MNSSRIIQKGQATRAFDVVILGPWLVYLSSRTSRLSRNERGALLLAGLGTIVYNWSRFQRQEKAGG